MLDRNDLFEAIVTTAVVLQSPYDLAAMRARVLFLEPSLDAERLRSLSRQLRPAPPVPDAFRPNQIGSGARSLGWELAWDQTLDEIFVQSRERGAQALRELAFREHLTSGEEQGGALTTEMAEQARAFHILSRLAVSGVEQEQFLKDVWFSLPRMPLTMQVLMVDALQNPILKLLSAANPGFRAGLTALARSASYRQAKRTLHALNCDQN